MSKKNDPLKQVEDDLYMWGSWVQGTAVVQGYGQSSWARKDQTQPHRIKKKIIQGVAAVFQYRDGQCVAGSSVGVLTREEIHQIHTPKQSKFAARQLPHDKRDKVCLEIDRCLAEMAKANTMARRLANHVYRYHSTREATMKDLRISRRRYDQLREYIPVFILGQRLTLAGQ